MRFEFCDGRFVKQAPVGFYYWWDVARKSARPTDQKSITLPLTHHDASHGTRMVDNADTTTGPLWGESTDQVTLPRTGPKKHQIGNSHTLRESFPHYWPFVRGIHRSIILTRCLFSKEIRKDTP